LFSGSNHSLQSIYQVVIFGPIGEIIGDPLRYRIINDLITERYLADRPEKPFAEEAKNTAEESFEGIGNYIIYIPVCVLFSASLVGYIT
jgi:hypothetical protein